MSNERSIPNRPDMTDFAVLPDEHGGYQTPDDPNRGPVILFLALGVMVVFGLVVWNAYKQGVRHSESTALPKIVAEAPIKVRPEVRGGEADRNTDLHVLDQLGGEIRPEGEIAPSVVKEEPVPVVEETAFDHADVAGEQDTAKQDTAKQDSGTQSYDDLFKPKSDTSAPPKTSSGGPVDLTPGAKRDLTSKPASTATSNMTASADLRRAQPADSGLEDLANKTIQKPAPYVRPAPKPTPKVPATVANGRFVVQLAAVKSKSDVAGIWQNAKKKAPNLFENTAELLQTVDLGAKGVWHRVQAGRFDSRASANAFCTQFKAQGGDCIVAERK